ncbi:MAG: hypothetical protein ACP5T1_06385 [Thermoplasmata archaeon]
MALWQLPLLPLLHSWAFMRVGVVDPLLPLIGKQMGADPFQVE